MGVYIEGVRGWGNNLLSVLNTVHTVQYSFEHFDEDLFLSTSLSAVQLCPTVPYGVWQGGYIHYRGQGLRSFSTYMSDFRIVFVQFCFH